MIHELIKLYGLDSREEYFDLIISNYTQNMFGQSKHMFHLMTADERKLFFEYVDTSHFYDGEDDTQLDMNSLYVFFEEDTSPWIREQDDDDESEYNSWQRWK